MSKSILVVDKQKCCSKCPLFFNVYTDMICKDNGRTIDYPFPDYKVQDWCPLKDVPKKYETVSIGFERGYNACIEEMLGENK